MTSVKETHIVNSEPTYEALGKLVRYMFDAHKYLVVTITTGMTRTQEQNAKMWCLFEDIAGQVVWYGKTYDKESWKDIITGSLSNAEFAPAIERQGFVVIGQRTKTMNRKEFSDLITYTYAFGDQQGVKWSEKSESTYQEYKQEQTD